MKWKRCPFAKFGYNRRSSSSVRFALLSHAPFLSSPPSSTLPHTPFFSYFFFLVDFEQFSIAKDMIQECLFHARTFDDKELQARCFHLSAIIAAHEDDVHAAIKVRNTLCNNYN